MKRKNMPGKKYERQITAQYGRLALLDAIFQRQLNVELGIKTKKVRNHGN